MEDCSNLMKFGIYDKYSTFTAEHRYVQIKSFFSSFQFSTRQQAESKAAELGLDIVDILGLSFNGRSSSTNFEQWQQELVKSSYQEAVHAGLSAQSVEKISANITDVVKTCLTRKGLHAYVIPSPDHRNFTFTLDFVPSSSNKPVAKGRFSVQPAAVAASASPRGLLDTELEIGPQGVSISLTRLPTETVVLTYNTDEGSGSIRYDAHVVPEPKIEFRAAQEQIQSGGTTTLHWSVENAQRVELEGRGQVLDTDSITVSPTRDTDFRLAVTSLKGEIISKFVHVEVVPPPAVLTAARVHFHTTDDNKDHDTRLTVNVQFGSSTVAAISGTFGEFEDHTDSGWIGLNVFDQPRKDAIIGGGRVELIQDPDGDDEWHFNWSLELTFSDGTAKRYDWGGINLDRGTDRRGL